MSKMPTKRKSKEPKGVWLIQKKQPSDRAYSAYEFADKSKVIRRERLEFLNTPEGNRGGVKFREMYYIPAPKSTIKKGAKKK